MTLQMKVSRSKTGKPTITESGGGMRNTGNSIVVCGRNGQRLKPVFTPRGYSNGDHAIFIVVPGKTCFIKAGRDRSGEHATIHRITKIQEDNTIETEIIGEYEDGGGNIPASFQAAVAAALDKTSCYHCREAHYIQ